MSNLYVRLFTNFYTHRKTLRLRAALGDAAYWIPPRLWAYAADSQPDGVFKDYSATELSSILGYTGDASRMLEALLKAGFMDDEPLRIHDWEQFNGFHQTFAERAKKAAAARWSKLPSTPSLDKTRQGQEASIAPSNALSIPPLSNTDKQIKNDELKRVVNRLKELGKLTDHDKGSKKYNEIIKLTNVQTELRNLLGVVV